MKVAQKRQSQELRKTGRNIILIRIGLNLRNDMNSEKDHVHREAKVPSLEFSNNQDSIWSEEKSDKHLDGNKMVASPCFKI